MLVLPAIDLLGGKAVRLYKGDYGAVTSYADDPVELARELADSGIRRLHLVDLDAAKGQGLHNRAIIQDIRQAVDCELELGGGIRSQADVDLLTDIGVDWLIIGTAIVKNPAEVERWIQSHPGRFIAGIDAYEGMVKIAGWIDGAQMIDTELGSRVKSMGFSAIIYTSIARDGTMEGPDTARTLAMAQASGLPVIISGGIGSTEDALKLAGLETQGISGFISGKALYEGRLDLPSLLKAFPQDTPTQRQA